MKKINAYWISVMALLVGLWGFAMSSLRFAFELRLLVLAVLSFVIVWIAKAGLSYAKALLNNSPTYSAGLEFESWKSRIVFSSMVSVFLIIGFNEDEKLRIRTGLNIIDHLVLQGCRVRIFASEVCQDRKAKWDASRIAMRSAAGSSEAERLRKQEAERLAAAVATKEAERLRKQEAERVAAEVAPKETERLREGRNDPNTRLELITSLQRELHRLGCYSGPIDGIWGRGSVRAVSRIQGLKGLPNTFAGLSNEMLDTLQEIPDTVCNRKIAQPPPTSQKATRTNTQGDCIVWDGLVAC